MRDVDASGRELTGEIQALHSRITKLEQVSHKSARRKNVDDELDKAWCEWETTFDAIKDSIILTDIEFRIVQANRAASQLFGKSLDEIIGKTCWHLVHGIDQPPKECPLKRAKNTKKHEEIELYLPQKGIWVTDSVDPVFDQQSNLTGAIHIIRDITDRKQAEQLLRKERDRAQQYLDVAGVVFVAIDAEQRVGLINKKGCQILGYSEEEIIAKNWFDNFLPEKIREQIRAVFEKTVSGEISSSEYYENPILTKNGQERLIAWHNTVLRDDKGQVIAVLSSGEDITERKRAEEALRSSENKYRTLLENLPQKIFLKDRNSVYISCNENYSGDLKIRAQDIAGKTDYDFYPKELAEKYRVDDKRIMEEDKTEEFEEEYLQEREKRWVHTVKTPVKDPHGNLIGILGIFWDITERKKAEEALQHSEEYFRALTENSSDIIIIVDKKGTILYMSSSIERFSGYKPEELISKSAFDFMHPDDLPRAINDFSKAIQTKDVAIPNSFRVRHKDGSERVLGGVGKNLFDNPVIKGFVMNVRDITERKKAEQKLLKDQAQLKSLASELTLAEERERRRLATELHDRISQSLVISKIKLDALRKSGRSRKLDKALEDVCNSIGQTIQDTRTLTFDLSSPVLYELGFETAVSEWLTDQIQKKHGLTVEFEDDGKAKPLDDDVRVLLFRDVRELLINVVKHAGAHKVKVSISKLDNHICVIVEDDGVGFDPAEVLSEAVRKGEFGLFSIRERLEQLGGHIEIDSTPGRGCKVTITAPLKQKEVTNEENRRIRQRNGN